jgi:ribosome maturation protein SDO1
MISLEKAVIARLAKGNEKFEILVDPDKAMEFKTGKDFPVEELVASEEIFEDVGKGTRAPNEKIGKAFGTTDLGTIAKKIIKEGDVQITTEQRKKMLDDKTKAIASTISKRGINPQTGVPHPADRILRVMEQAKVRVDLNKRVEDQIESVLSAIQKVIPIKFEMAQLAIKIPSEFAGRASSVVRTLGTLQREEWANDGGYIALIEIPAGMQPEVYDRLNNLTHGQVEVKVVKKQ